jgi:hypothetical protein
VKPFDEYPVGARLLCAFRTNEAPWETRILEITKNGYTRVSIGGECGPETWYRPDNTPTVLEELPSHD